MFTKIIAVVLSVLLLTALQPSSSAEASAPADQAVSYATSKVGAKYLWGGNGPSYDCSGLTQQAYRSAGISIPRTSSTQFYGTTRISRSQLRPGDLVFWHGHVAMYIGNSRIVESANSASGVRIRTLGYSGWDGQIRGYGRVSGAHVNIASAPEPEPEPVVVQLRPGEVLGDVGLDTDRTETRRRVRSIRESRGLAPDYPSDQVWAERIRDRRTHHLGHARIAITRKGVAELRSSLDLLPDAASDGIWTRRIALERSRTFEDARTALEAKAAAS